ncbi:MAG: hypothetical protein AAGC68_11180, partial [Verrucomicrobiota bacterium]
MKRLGLILILLALVGLGYLMGSQIRSGSISSSTEENGSKVNSSSEISKKTTGSDRAPPTFASKQERLAELASETADFGILPYLREGKRAGTAMLEIERIFALADREELIAWFAEEDLDSREDLLLNAAFQRLAELTTVDALSIWADFHERSGRLNGVKQIVSVWALTAPQEAEQWVDGLESDKARQLALFALLDSAAQSDLEILDRRITEVRNTFETLHLATLLARATDPSQMESLSERFLGENAGNFRMQNELIRILQAWGEKDPTAMMTWVMNQKPGTFKDHVIPQAVQSQAKDDPAGFVQNIEPHLSKNSPLVPAALTAWLDWFAESDSDSDASVAWFEKHAKLFDSNPTSWRHDYGRTEAELRHILEKIPVLPDGTFKLAITKGFLYQLSNFDPMASVSYGIEHLPTGHDADNVVASALSRLAEKGEPEAAFEWAVENLEPGEGKDTAVRFVLHSWSRKDPLEAAEYASTLEGILRERAFEAVAMVWAEESPEKIVDFIQSESSSGIARELTEQAYHSIGYRQGGEDYLADVLAIQDEATRH